MTTLKAIANTAVTTNFGRVMLVIAAVSLLNIIKIAVQIL